MGFGGEETEETPELALCWRWPGAGCDLGLGWAGELLEGGEGLTQSRGASPGGEGPSVACEQDLGSVPCSWVSASVPLTLGVPPAL